MSVPLPQLEALLPLHGKRVLLRCDFNVPVQDSQIVDDGRIRAALPTLRWLHQHGATVTACSHLGRPRGAPNPKYSLAPVRQRLADLAPDVEVELLENLRFDPGEEADDPVFVARLVHGQDAYVNDAFGAAHRDHASIVGPPRTLPAAAGRLLAREVEVLSRLRENPARRFVAVVGGAKVSDKLGAIEGLLSVCDALLIGGAMCFTFLAAQGWHIGASLVEPDRVGECRRLLARHRDRVHLPEDIVALSPDGDIGAPHVGGRVQVVHAVAPGWRGVDIGPATAAAFAELIAGAGTVFWNGPLGVYEDPRFAGGTRAVAEAVAACAGFTVVAGGDTGAALAQFGAVAHVDHLSTGGGASLALLEHGDLPGLAALRDAPPRWW